MLDRDLDLGLRNITTSHKYSGMGQNSSHRQSMVKEDGTKTKNVFYKFSQCLVPLILTLSKEWHLNVLMFKSVSLPWLEASKCLNV